MRFLSFLALGCAAVGACQNLPLDQAAPPAAETTTVVAEARLAFIGITGTLPEPGNSLPPDLLASLNDLVPVRLDLMLQPPLLPTAEKAGADVPLEDCAFGVVAADTVSVPTGSYHMILDVRLGSPEEHPANLLSCEYDTSSITDESLGLAYRIRGCYLPQSVSIPTAELWVLNPLPPAACGLGD
jgi:hypothetical protein